MVSAAIKLRCQFGQGDSRHEGGLGTPLSLGSAQVSSRCKMQCVHVSCLGVYLCVYVCVCVGKRDRDRQTPSPKYYDTLTPHRPKFCISPSSMRKFQKPQNMSPPSRAGKAGDRWDELTVARTPWSNTGSHRWPSVWWGSCFNTQDAQTSRHCSCSSASSATPTCQPVSMPSTDQCHFSCVNLLATPDAVKGESQSIPQISQLGSVDVT